MRCCLPLVLVASLLVGCPPGRSTNESDPAPTGPDAAWLVLTAVSGNNTSTSHSFARWDRSSGLCAAMQQYYAGQATAYAEYTAAYTAFQQTWDEQPYAYDDPEYRRDYCELYQDYYASFAAAWSAFDNDQDVLMVNLYHPDSSDGSPVADSYEAGPPPNGGDDDDSAAGDDDDSVSQSGPQFDGYRSVYHGNYYQLYVDSMDCEAYAADPNEGLYPELEGTEDLIESFTVIEGSLDVSSESSSAWRLTLSDGRQRADAESQTVSDIALDASFERCDVTYETPAYDG